MRTIFIDTNILVYAFDPLDPRRQDIALKIIKQLDDSKSGCLSTQCLAEFVHATTRSIRPKLTREQAVQQVQRLVVTYPVFDLNKTIILEAGRGFRDHHLPYYDAQIWATAHLNQIPLVFSEDFQDGLYLEGVRFVNPFTETFKLEEWI
jgi:predicted nucleic acid-binding protein